MFRKIACCVVLLGATLAPAQAGLFDSEPKTPPAVSNETGAYQFPFVQPGTYDIEATLDGFKTLRREGLVLSAAQNAVLEEVLVAGYLLHRLRQLGWSDNRALLVSALLRGSYHLYQGFGGFAGTVAMGLLFGRLYQRWGRVTPLVVAHTLIDVVAFVGYAELAGHVSWLPTT